MKPFLLAVALCCAVTTQAQKFDISLQAGYAATRLATPYSGEKASGIASRASFGYRPLKHLSLSLSYDYNDWNPKHGTGDAVTHALYFSPGYVTRYFFAGIEAGIAMPAAGAQTEDWQINYHPGFAYGIHAGLRQQLGKHLSLLEQVNYNVIAVRAIVIPPPSIPIIVSHGAWFDGDHRSMYEQNTTMKTYTIRIGLSYSF